MPNGSHFRMLQKYVTIILGCVVTPKWCFFALFLMCLFLWKIHRELGLKWKILSSDKHDLPKAVKLIHPTLCHIYSEGGKHFVLGILFLFSPLMCQYSGLLELLYHCGRKALHPSACLTLELWCCFTWEPALAETRQRNKAGVGRTAENIFHLKGSMLANRSVGMGPFCRYFFF